MLKKFIAAFALVVGVIWVLGGLLSKSILSIVLGIFLLIVGIALNKKPTTDGSLGLEVGKPQKKESQPLHSEHREISEGFARNVKVECYRVAGVTFDDDFGNSRQEMLKNMFVDEVENDGIAHHTFKFEDYTYQGKPAIHVIVDGHQIGSVHAKDLDKVNDFRSHGIDIDTFEILCGGDSSSVAIDDIEDGEKFDYNRIYSVEYGYYVK